jgi:hypothetical protein
MVNESRQAGAEALAASVRRDTAGAPEVRITREMQLAGLDALDPTTAVRLHEGWADPISVAEKVFRAMILADKSHP